METTNSKGSLYWLAKGFIIFFILFSAYYSYTHVEDLRKLGFPDYFRNELVIAKVLGAIVLIVPFSTLRMREWVYAGFIITMVSAITAHICSGDPLAKIIFACLDLCLVFISMKYVSAREIAQENFLKQTIHERNSL
jgi:putative oxidoreductase